jgi:hypothetical protein
MLFVGLTNGGWMSAKLGVADWWVLAWNPEKRTETSTPHGHREAGYSIDVDGSLN